MREVSKIEYIKSFKDYEQCYFISTEYGIPYLRADIEHGEEIGLRIETMYFRLIPNNSNLYISMNLSELNSNCRGYYAGGISFIEYETYEEAEQCVLEDFISISDSEHFNTYKPVFLKCKEKDLLLITQRYPNSNIYLLVE